MPLQLHKKIQPQGELGIWEIAESEEYFFDLLDLTPIEKLQVSRIKGRRRLEWLASRWLIHKMSGRHTRGAVLKDKFGKPRLINSKWNISISHSDGKAAVIASPYLVGIDIQKIVSKIGRIAHKYMRTVELDSLEEATKVEHLHVYWGAKEALYKAYGRKELDFKKHILINPFQYNVTNGACSGYVKKGRYNKSFSMKYERIDDYIFVYAIIEK